MNVTLRLLLDWCVATETSTDSLDSDALDRFFTQVPCSASTRSRRLRELNLAARAARGGPLPDVSRMHGDVWPYGMNVRRDKALIGLLGTGLTRSSVPTLPTAAVRLEPLAGVFDPASGGWTDLFDLSPERCPGCWLADWLAVLAAWNVGGRVECQALLDSRAEPGGHTCAAPLADSWRTHGPLFCAIDRHGSVCDQPLTDRAARMVLSDYRSNAHPTARAASPAMGTRPPPDPELGALLDRLDLALEQFEQRLCSLGVQAP